MRRSTPCLVAQEIIYSRMIRFIGKHLHIEPNQISHPLLPSLSDELYIDHLLAELFPSVLCINLDLVTAKIERKFFFRKMMIWIVIYVRV